MMDAVSNDSKVAWNVCATALAMLSMLVLGAMVANRTPTWKDVSRGIVPAARIAIFLMIVASILYIFTAILLSVGAGTSFSGAVGAASRLGPWCSSFSCLR